MMMMMTMALLREICSLHKLQNVLNSLVRAITKSHKLLYLHVSATDIHCTGSH